MIEGKEEDWVFGVTRVRFMIDLIGGVVDWFPRCEYASDTARSGNGLMLWLG